MNWTLKSVLPAMDLGWNHVRARCGLSTCHNKLLMRPVPQRGTGINMGNEWYCSVDCFVAAARSPLAALAARRVVEMPRNPRLSLGLALLAKGFLTEGQLRLATDQSQLEGEDLENTLLRLGWTNDKQRAAARAAQWGYPVLSQERPGHRVEADIPLTMLRSFSAAPLFYSASAKRLVLGFVERVDHRLLLSLEQVTGCRAEPCFLSKAEFADQMRCVVTPAGYTEVVVEEPGEPAQMARTLGRCALDVAATEADFVQCKTWVWARLIGKRGTVDVLFAKANPAPATNFSEVSFAAETVGALG